MQVPDEIKKEAILNFLDIEQNFSQKRFAIGRSTVFGEDLESDIPIMCSADDSRQIWKHFFYRGVLECTHSYLLLGGFKVFESAELLKWLNLGLTEVAFQSGRKTYSISKDVQWRVKGHQFLESRVRELFHKLGLSILTRIPFDLEPYAEILRGMHSYEDDAYHAKYRSTMHSAVFSCVLLRWFFYSAYVESSLDDVEQLKIKEHTLRWPGTRDRFQFNSMATPVNRNVYDILKEYPFPYIKNNGIEETLSFNNVSRKIIKHYVATTEAQKLFNPYLARMNHCTMPIYVEVNFKERRHYYSNEFYWRTYTAGSKNIPIPRSILDTKSTLSRESLLKGLYNKIIPYLQKELEGLVSSPMVKKVERDYSNVENLAISLRAEIDHRFFLSTEVDTSEDLKETQKYIGTLKKLLMDEEFLSAYDTYLPFGYEGFWRHYNARGDDAVEQFNAGMTAINNSIDMRIRLFKAVSAR